jgi:hypothetical protein
MKIAGTFFVILMGFSFLGPALCEGQQASPVDVVRSFSACYGGPCMDDTADHTTGHFRDNKPKSVWVIDTWKALRKTGYQKVKDRIIGSKTLEERSAVLVEAKIRTVAGETQQKEVYYLIKEGQRWLIDDLQVTDEAVELDEEKFQM